MSTMEPTGTEPTSEEMRLGELVERYEMLRQADDSVGIGTLQDEAGDFFPELAELAECLGHLKQGLGATAEEVPSAIGPYTVEAVLGSGVSGTVYRARRLAESDADFGRLPRAMRSRSSASACASG